MATIKPTADHGGNDVKEQKKIDDTLDVAQEDFEELVQLANSGDEDALVQLRETLDKHPTIWEHMGDMAKHAQIAMVNLIANGNKVMAESLGRTTAKMKEELLRPSPSKLEELAAERVVACWLEMEYLNTTYPIAEGETLGQANFVLRQKESAERRFNTAVKSLSTLRKLVPSDSSSASEQTHDEASSGHHEANGRCRRKKHATNGHHGPNGNGRKLRKAKRKRSRQGVPVNRVRHLVGVQGPVGAE